MKHIISLLSIALLLLVACTDDDTTDNSQEPTQSASSDIDYKEEMRSFVIGISEYAKGIDSDFNVIPQNGIELVTENGEDDGEPHSSYLAAIDCNGQEDLFYGYDDDNVATPSADNAYLRALLNVSKDAGNVILVTDYCSTHSKMDDSYSQNHQNGYISFAADERDLLNIPDYPSPIYNANSQSISSLSDAKNFLYLINPEDYSSKSDFIDAVTNTNYDLLIMDLFFNGDASFTASEINALKAKKNGGSRLVICYMSIGEAEDYRYYWDSDWSTDAPDWLDEENPYWEGNYKVKYWYSDWQQIIYGNDTSYLKKIIDADFDGVYLDIIDAFEYYE